MKLLVLVVLVTLCGCAVRGPASFRLQEHVLVPPFVKDSKVVSASIALPGICAADRAPGVLKGKRLRIERSSLEKQPAGSIGAWADECDPSGRLAERIAYSVPLSTNGGFQLLYSNDRQTGWVDLTPRTRIQVVSPVLREGTPDDAVLVNDNKLSDAVIGFETAWFTVEGNRVVAGKVERTIAGVKQAADRPLKNYFPTEAAYLRIVYKSGNTEYTQILITGRTRAELEAKTRTTTGTPIPKRVAVNVLVPVTVNGSEILVHWGSSAMEAVRRSGAETTRVLETLEVKKPYQGRLMPVKYAFADKEILNLILTGGESLSWR